MTRPITTRFWRAAPRAQPAPEPEAACPDDDDTQRSIVPLGDCSEYRAITELIDHAVCLHHHYDRHRGAA